MSTEVETAQGALNQATVDRSKYQPPGGFEVVPGGCGYGPWNEVTVRLVPDSGAEHTEDEAALAEIIAKHLDCYDITVKAEAREITARIVAAGWSPPSQRTRIDGLREAADVIHAEARWQAEQHTGTAQSNHMVTREYLQDRLILLERILSDRIEAAS